nr:Chromosome-associated kinesin kif4a [Polyrhizophydium stewartii]
MQASMLAPAAKLSAVAPSKKSVLALADIDQRRKTFPLRHTPGSRQLAQPAKWNKLHALVDKLSSSRTLVGSSRLSIDVGTDDACMGAAQQADRNRADPSFKFGPGCRAVPRPIATKIISLLPPESLARCSAMQCFLAGVFSEGVDDELLASCPQHLPQGVRWMMIFGQHAARKTNWRLCRFRKQIIDIIEPNDAITCFEQDANTIVVGSREHLLQSTHISSPAFWREPAPHGILVSADTSGDLAFWNSFTGQMLASLKHAHRGGVSSICVVDSEHAVTAGFDRLIRLYRLVSVHQQTGRADGTLMEAPCEHSRQGKTYSGQIVLDPVMTKRHHRNHSSCSDKTASAQLRRSSVDSTSSSRSGSIKGLRKSTSEGPLVGLQQPSKGVAEQKKAKGWRLPRLVFGKRRKDQSMSERTLLLVHEMKGHKGDIYCLVLLDGGARLASGSSDQTIKIWNTRGGQCVTTLKGHSQAVTCLKHAGGCLFSGSLDRTIRRWDVATGACLQVMAGHMEWIKTIDANASHLASGGWDETVFVWSLGTGALLHKIKLDMGPILGIQCSPSRIVRLSRLGREASPGSMASVDSVAATLKSQTLPISRTYSPSGPTSGSGIRKSFTFDHVFGPEASQGHIYDSLAAPLVDQFFAGFNATILAYGQTFSGKTFTMGSSNDHRTPEPVRGIIPRIVLDVFRHIEIRDLLMPGNDQREISIRENRQGVITIAGVHEEWVATPAELLKCLHLVDLAGSERLKRTGAEGVRLRESVKINSGLLALGNVISVLGADRPARASETPHVPYRDSKLTRPLEDDMDETLNTLK